MERKKGRTVQNEIVLETVEKFKDLPIRTLAKYILYKYGELFDYDLELIRSRLRYICGKSGEKHRKYKRVYKTDVKLPSSWKTISDPYKVQPGIWLILSDIHIPFHDVKAIEAAVKYAKTRKITGILLNGDIQDHIALSFWQSHILRNFDKEYMLVCDFFDYLRSNFKKQEIVWKPGNHERRLPSFYVKRMPEMIATPLLAMEALLRLPERGIELIDLNQIVYMGELPVFHGHEIRYIQAVNPARMLFMRIKQWGLMAHAHQTSEHTEKNLQGTYLTTWSVGCLCNLNPEWNPYGNSWNHGFAIVEVTDKGFFNVENKRILPGGEIA